MSGFSFVLRSSGFLGLAVGFVAQFYIALLRDSILYGGAQFIPGWLSEIATILLFGSLAVLFYGAVLDDVLRGWVDLLTICAVGGQWGVPLGIYLRTTTGAGSPAGLLVVVGYAFHALAALAVAVAYLRRGRKQSS